MTPALAEEWAGDGIKVNCVNPERTATPMRVANFGEEPPGTLLTPEEVAEASWRSSASGKSGHIVDVRRHDSADSPAAANARRTRRPRDDGPVTESLSLRELQLVG